MITVPVFVESWQHECCGERFAVGSRVRWRVAADEHPWVLDPLGDHAPRWAAHLPVVARLDADDPDDVRVVVGAGALHVFVRAEAPPMTTSGDVVVHGPLIEDHHIGVPSEVAPTEGVVRRIRTVHIAYQHDADRCADVPAPGSARLGDVREAQRWNDDLDDGRRFKGFLVDLQANG